MRGSFAGKLAFMLVACCCMHDDYAEARRTHYNEHRNRREHRNRNEHANSETKGEDDRPYYFESPLKTGLVDPDFFNL